MAIIVVLFSLSRIKEIFRNDYLFTVDSLNEMVVAGVPFRDAYKAVAEQLENGTFKSPKETKHTHEGSINNLCLDAIKDKMKRSY